MLVVVVVVVAFAVTTMRRFSGTAAAAIEKMGQPRYLGLNTFFRLPSFADKSPTEAASEVDIGLVGVPYDGGVTNRPGAR